MSEPKTNQPGSTTKEDAAELVAAQLDFTIAVTAKEMIDAINSKPEVRQAVLSGVKVTPTDFLVNPWDINEKTESAVSFIKNNSELFGRKGTMRIDFTFNDFNVEEI